MQSDAAQPGNDCASRILVLDDEPTIASALTATLEIEGYEVVAHTEPLKALESVKLQEFAVILSDQKMPELTGLQFFAKAREFQPNASRVLITAVLSLDTVIDSINTGEIYRFIVKPWLREELLVTVRNAVQRYELICHNQALQERTQAMNRELQAQVTHIGEQNEQLIRVSQALQENLDRSIDLCLRMLEAFLPVLGSQARRVHHLCRAMADVLHLADDQRRLLEVSSYLFDIGLVGIPRALIRRWRLDPKTLTSTELKLIEQHPVIGEELARFAHGLQGVAGVIRSHHERFDGTGYPDQLQGSEIPLLARLLSVAVSFAEMDADQASAAEVVQFSSGTAYDPEAVRALLMALPKSQLPRREAEVLLSELRPGMQLAKGIYTANGMLLLAEGQRLTQDCIDKVRNHNRVSPITQALMVYC